MLTTVNRQELADVFEMTPSSQNIMIAGKHGIGKSEIVKDYFASKGKRVVTMFCSQAADPGDIIGLPHYDDATGVTEFALPWWFPTDGTPVVLFLDELNRARPEILQVVMDLTLSRTLAGQRLPEGSQIISAVNVGDEYQLTDMDPALVSRFNIYKFEPSVQDWIDWATAHDVDQRVITFISQNSSMLDSTSLADNTADSLICKTADRRSWVRASDILKGAKAINTSLKKVLCGVVGGNAATALYELLSKNLIVTPDMLLSDFESVRERLGTYKIQEYSGLNDSICSYIGLSLGKDYDSAPKSVRDRFASNLGKYLDFLETAGHGGREAFAHFVNNYESQVYENLSCLIASYPDLLESRINDFIISTSDE